MWSIRGGESAPLAEQFTAKHYDASSVSHSDSCPEEYESDDEIVYFSSSCTLEINGDSDESPEIKGDSDESDDDEDADESDGAEDDENVKDDDEDADGSDGVEDDKNVKDEVLSQGKVDEGTDPEFDSCRPLKEEKLSSQGKVDEGSDPEFDSCRPSKQEKPSQEAVNKLKEMRASLPWTVKVDGTYYFHIYAYVREGGYGGYGIVILNSSRVPIDAYCGASKGGSYMYHIMMGMKRGLQIASKRGLHRVMWGINSNRAANYYTNIFGDYCMLEDVFHSQYDAANAHICWKCLSMRMGLTGATLKELVPVIKSIIKLQYDTKFKYREFCIRFSSDAAYYAARCGEQALLRQEGEEQKIEMKMQHPQKLTHILKSEKTSLGCECWYVLHRGLPAVKSQMQDTETPKISRKA